MNAQLFIIRRSLINWIKELRRKPGKLVLVIVVTAILVGLILMTVFSGGIANEPSPLFWFTGMLFAFVAFIMVMTVRSGLLSGDAIFEMNDVNLLFVSPVSSKKILLYGIIKMAKTSLFGSIFILFQSGTLANFGVGFNGVLITFAVYFLSFIVLTIASLVIYSSSCGREKRKRIVKGITIALFLPAIIFTVFRYLQTQDIFMSLEAVITSPFLRYIPVAGWTASSVTAFFSGEMLSGFFFLGLNLILGIGLTIYILHSNSDYFEDVLVATETAFEKQRAVAEGDLNAVTASNRKTKVTKTGISGIGASAIFGKHVRESFRQSRLGVFTILSALMVVGAVAATFFIRDLLIVLQILLWIKLFTIGTGKGIKETCSHYIYMIPVSSFSKIIWSNMETMAKTFVEGVLIFIIGGIIIAASPMMVVACILAYTLFSFLIIGVNYLYMRYAGTDISSGLLVLIYFLAIAIIIAPGVVLGIVTASIIGGGAGNAFGVLVLAAWSLVAGLSCYGLSKGVLHNCDMQSITSGKR